MAIDPKYANLPGIAQNQPDLYESADLPEVDQLSDTEPDIEDENVEKFSLNPNEAFNKFKGKTLEGRVNYSKNRRPDRRPDHLPQNEYEILGDESGEKETPLQKYQRLQHELNELADECSQLKSNAQSAKGDPNPVQLSGQVQYLQQQLADLHLENILGKNAKVDLADPQGELNKRLLSQIDSFKDTSATSGDKKKPKADDNLLKYELYYKPEQAKFSYTAKMADLDERLERLEAVIGHNPEKLSSLTADLPNKTVMGAVAHLTAKTGIFEPDSLELVEARLSSLSHKLNKLNENKDHVEEAEKISKVAAMYDLVKKWETVSCTVPKLVGRLASLKEVHEQALQFSQALTYLDTSQQQISNNLKLHTDLLKEVNESFKSNVGQIDENCKSLSSRLSKIKK